MTIPTNSAPIIGRGVSSIVVEETPASSLKPYRANARTHTKHQIRQIADSIVAFGFTNRILIDSNNRIIAGHGRFEAAKLLGMERVPTIRLEGLNEDQIRAYVLADISWPRMLVGIRRYWRSNSSTWSNSIPQILT